MKIIEIIAIVLSVLIVGGVVLRGILNKKKGKCSCDCSHCPYNPDCNKNEKK